MQLTSLIIPILLLAVMWFLLIRPQQKRAKEHRELINRVEAGQKITTIGGIKGTIKAVDETSVVITVNGLGTEMTLEKPAIKQVDPS
ncbi:preprotein translocase subunit YajC [Staphylococcus saccharolyticus]|uniref:Preprotein translocase, YajC subunit n=1 Tax=Staphylococcus saccharolyticus TaxID=33028 RepID=A0A380H3L1_9STAP|nr:preprotein translocase subunit YajC [Staphylococcus saccharolyticus]MBL7565104.1 preprotein translocase subunit YajC [Staphylococcus saccharolyticus]MBL7571859.1 preprotein translocase subunit YajC [Staphylococcus saccharolyticus]QQB98344.1 preprotein translocase subunit YajC [Staphylococcus saccharolyticus]QRJ67441.1 preprotein translocase subunit YajC [Staphylococcus saccharolyticus]RTX97890.1 preprotein translocase subunit YajC [Staphylococcus saccharolyticus]